MNKAYKYSDVTLIPQYSECESRSDCDTSIELFERKYRVPIIPANMKSVIDLNLSSWMSENNYFYIMHRFDNDLADDVAIANSENWKTISFSTGVQDTDKEKIHKIKKRGNVIDFLTIDIAHGHSIKMKRMIEFIKENLPNTKIIAGNVATPQAVKDLSGWGADIVKVGVGQGSPCTTKDKTGFTVPMFSCVQSCSNLYNGEFEDEEHKKIPIIADGGVSCNGDIAKALVAGAKMVMAGGLFAACTDSPAKLIKFNGDYLKGYFGSASYENKGKLNHIEGKLNAIEDNRMTYERKLEEIEEDIQSAISYAGGDKVKVFNSVEFIKV